MKLAALLCLSACLAACGARTHGRPGDGSDGGDGGDAGPYREPFDDCHEEDPEAVLFVSGWHYDIFPETSTIYLRFGVGFCGASVSEQPILVNIVRANPETPETVLFEGQVSPGLPHGYAEFLEVTLPYFDRDCLVIDLDPLGEVQACPLPEGHCTVYRVTC